MENTSVPYSGDSSGKAEWGTKQALLKRYEGGPRIKSVQVK